MDRRGFVTSGFAAGLAGLSGTAVSLPGLIDTLPGWTPRTQLADDPIKLSSNENPLGLSPAAREAVVAAIVDANRYPGAYATPLYEALGAHLGVARENIILGAGSTEILQTAVHAYQGPGVPLIVAEPTFEDVADYQRPLSFEMISVPVTETLAHDVGRMREEAEAVRRPVIVYFCSPNNPTGTITPSAEIDRWIADAPETTMFLMDEAYFEYVEDSSYWSALKWIEDKPNVIVVRTFSKIFGMAGMRLGYGVAHPDTITRLNDFIMQNNPNVLAAAAGVASLQDEGLMERSRAVNREARAITEKTLDELSLEYTDTHCNFIMHRISGDLRTYIDRMAEAGVRVGRPFPPMVEWNRLSFGLPEEMERWSETIRDFRRKGWV